MFIKNREAAHSYRLPKRLIHANHAPLAIIRPSLEISAVNVTRLPMLREWLNAILNQLLRPVACVLLLTAGDLDATAATGLRFVEDGRAIARIYRTPKAALAAPDRKTRHLLQVDDISVAVDELNHHLAKMSGATLPVIETNDPALIRGPAIVLGDLAVKLGAGLQRTTVSREGFRVLGHGDRLLIAGESPKGTIFGVYEVLRRLGCDWVMPGAIGEITPSSPTLELPDIDVSKAPDFPMRKLWYRGGATLASDEERARLAQWLRRQGGGDYAPPARQVAGHYWPVFIKKHKTAFDADPSLYALKRTPRGDLVRAGPQIETTNPRVVDMMVADIKERFEKQRWPKDKIVGFPIGSADYLGYSESPESVAVGSGLADPVVGAPDQTDQLILLGNQILERLGSEYPNVYVGYYSYFVHSGFPVRYRPHPRIAQIFAPIGFSRFHSLIDRSSKGQSYYKRVIDKWGELSGLQGNPLLYRGYNWNLADNLLPYSKVRIWGEELPYYKKLGIQALDVEATKAWSINGPSDWVFMRLAWDSSQDWRSLIEEYCRKSFGAGAEPMLRMFMRLIATQHDAGLEAGSYTAFSRIYDRAFIAASRADMDQAIARAATADEKTRIGHFASNIAGLELYLDFDKAIGTFDFARAKILFDAMKAHWQIQHDANSDLVALEGPSYLDRFWKPFVDQGAAFATGQAGRMLERLPDAMRTILDPAVRGDELGFQNPEVRDDGFIETRTYSRSWDEQGLAALRSGAVWYRHRFTVPPEERGKPIGLFLGGFRDDARVWVNGVLAGTRVRGTDGPAQLDLTPYLNRDGPNLLAIQVVERNPAGELGVGGLYRPSFLFVGQAPGTNLPAAAPNAGGSTGGVGADSP